MARQPPAYQFSHALVRTPAPSVVAGLRAVDSGDPDFTLLLAEHRAYIAALEQAGVTVQVLPPDDAFPDSVFVEDPALVFGEGAILLRPGAESRLGEAARLRPVLEDHFPQVLDITPDGFAEGGDMLNTGREVMIGLSGRTNPAGARSVVLCLQQLGRKGVIVATPAGVLHFKTDCALLDEDTILSTARLAASGVFRDYRTLIIPEGEEAAANALRVNDTLFLGAGYQRTRDLLDTRGYNLTLLDTREVSKVDAGLSCMSLRWHA